jgi:hypothetical protein
MPDLPRRPRPPRDDDEPPRKRPRPARKLDDLEEVPEDQDTFRVRDGEDDAPPPSKRTRPVRDEDEDRPLRKKRPRPIRADDDEDEGEDDRPRKKRPRSASVASMDLRVKLILWGVGIVIVLLVVVFFVTRYLAQVNQTAPFKPFMSAYLAPPKAAAPGAIPPRVGKMVVIDSGTQEVDWLWFDLPDQMRAANPSQVVTVVLIQWTKTHFGDYDNGAKAYQHSCDVTVIDQATRTVIGTKHFVGSEPPETIQSSQSGEGSKPTAEVLTFLKKLGGV